MQAMGNSNSTAVYEANIPDDFKRPRTVSSLQSFIRQKYVTRKYVLSDWVPVLQDVPVSCEEPHSRGTSPTLGTSCPRVESRTVGTPAVFMDSFPHIITSTPPSSTSVAGSPGLFLGSSTPSPHPHSFLPYSAYVTANVAAIGGSVPNTQVNWTSILIMLLIYKYL